MSSSDKPRPNPTYVQVSEEVGHPSPSEGLRFVSQPVPWSSVARAVLCGEERATDLQNQKTRFQEIKIKISSTRQAIAVFRNKGQDPPGSLVDSLTSLYEDLEETSLRSPPSPRGRHQPSDAPKLHRSSRSHANRQRHHSPETSAAGLSGYLGRPSEQFTSRPQVASFAQPTPSSEDGSHQRKKRRLSSGESSADEEEVSTASKSLHHSRVDEDQDNPSHAPSLRHMLAYIMDKFPSASAPLAQPSAKPFSVLATVGLAEESSDHASLLAWYEAIQSVCDVSQQRYETNIRDGKSWSTVLPSVSRFERVSNSPSQGRELKVNSPVFDLLALQIIGSLIYAHILKGGCHPGEVTQVHWSPLASSSGTLPLYFGILRLRPHPQGGSFVRPVSAVYLQSIGEYRFGDLLLCSFSDSQAEGNLPLSHCAFCY